MSSVCDGEQRPEDSLKWLYESCCIHRCIDSVTVGTGCCTCSFGYMCVLIVPRGYALRNKVYVLIVPRGCALKDVVYDQYVINGMC